MHAFKPFQLRLVRSVSGVLAAVSLERQRLEVSRRTLACEESESLWKGFRPEFRGQLTPFRKATTALVALHGGPFNSRWVRVQEGAFEDDLCNALAKAEDGAKAAIYVGIPDDHQRCGQLVAKLKARGFKFHHFFETEKRDAGTPSGELVYYRWGGKGPDMVPTYATALEGIGVLILSPDSKEILLVWEYGHWKMITGNVDAGESVLATAEREAEEEVGLKLKRESMRLVGGWQHSKKNDLKINNAFYVFTATAQSKEMKVDGVEIVEARWFPIDALPRLPQEEAAPKVKHPHAMEWDVGSPGRNIVSRAVVRFLECYHENRGLKIQPVLNMEGQVGQQDLFL